MLKQWLSKDNRTLLDYFQQKEKESLIAQPSVSERIPVLIRKRKVQGI